MVDLEKYRASEREKARTDDLLRLLPRGRESVLEIGCREGHFSRLLTGIFPRVTALDIEEPTFEFPGVTTVAGDVTSLDFPDNAFDCTFCAEVLEHVPDLEKACREMIRVTRHEIVIGVPFRQDIRLGRTTCRSCGGINPPWGHIHSFDEKCLRRLFPGLRVLSQSFVGVKKDATNFLAAFLMDLAGNPWGAYEQDEPCIHCGAALAPPPERQFYQRVCSAIAVRLNRAQSFFVRPHGRWIHMVFSRAR
jgi:SAM-dependent methyltransferase